MLTVGMTPDRIVEVLEHLFRKIRHPVQFVRDVDAPPLKRWTSACGFRGAGTR